MENATGKTASDGRSWSRRLLERVAVGVGIVLLIFLPVVLKPHLLFTYVSATAAFAFMAFSVYGTDRKLPEEKLPSKEFSWFRSLDVVDLFLVTFAWLILVLVSELAPAPRDLGADALVISGAVVMWVRRLIFPRSAVRFRPENARVRTGAIFCGLHALVTLMFGFTGRWIDASPILTWGFFLTAAGLLVVALRLYRLELRRSPRAQA